MPHRSTKTYGHDVGLSVAFRQWRADSHCHFVHGYAIAVSFVFEANTLDNKGWVVDFGDLKDLKAWLQAMFDHKFVVATDDPHIEYFRKGDELGVLDLVEVAGVGCERFAELIYTHTKEWLAGKPEYKSRVTLMSVEVREHGANSGLKTDWTL
jgi:6-pyruvoyltetrahydropterin/6-carboxytetrahydropterin synthase